jgi:hypothetical protein
MECCTKNDHRERPLQPAGRPVGLRWRSFFGAAIAGAVLLQAGCTRLFYRKQADKEVAEVLADKDKYPDWQIDFFHVYPDPRARYADPSNPDFPPKPPDDPAAYDLAPNPQKPGKAGVARIEGTGYLELIARWDKENRERDAKEDAEALPNIGLPEPAAPAMLPGSADAGPVAANGEIKWVSINNAPANSPPPNAVPPGNALPPANAVPPANAAAPANAAPQPELIPTVRDALVEANERSSLDMKGRPAFRLTLDQAAELAVFNSREYQDQREALYLAALPVTLERFSFTSQLFGAQEAVRDYAGQAAVGGPSNNWSLNNGAGVSKVLPTGALLLLNFSNQTVFDFLNPKSTISSTSINFSAVQPLLQGGGQAVALESLTQAERNLLYQIRTYARFRKQLYVEIASNNGGSINGSSFQPVGVLSNNNSSSGGLNNSGVTPGVIPSSGTSIAGPILPPNTPGVLNLQPTITPAPSGYLNTMLQNVQVYIDKENIDVLSVILKRYRGLLEGDVVGPLQVQNVEQQLLGGRVTLLNDQQDYVQSLDQFKIEIGVPMNLSIEMDDTVVRPLLKQFRRSRAIIEDEQAAVEQAAKLMAPDKVADVRAELLRLFQQSILVRGTPFAGTIAGRVVGWSKLSDKELRDKLEANRKEIQALLDRQTDLQVKEQSLSPAEQDRLKQLRADSDLGNYERTLRQYESAYLENGKPKKLDRDGERKRIAQFRDVASNWQRVLVEARDDRWNAVRASWPELPRCCVDGHDLVWDDLFEARAAAARFALLHRLDLMNVRAQVVDAWRQLAVYANALLGVFNVGYNLNSGTPGGGVGGSGNAHQLIINTQLPLVRIQERNNYRASLIAYQRQRRALQEAEDFAIQVVNDEIYLLRQYAETYKIQQRQLELAYLTIDSSLEALQAPTPPGAVRTGQDGPAALTQQLLNAQRTLPTAQNGLLTIWINYLDARLSLYRDLELMPLDARGVWIDEIRACDCSLTPPGVPTAGTQQRLPDPPQPPPSAGKKME